MNYSGTTNMHPDQLTIRATLSSLDVQIQAVLDDNGVYDVTMYGWQDHDTPDPNSLGHYLWQAAPPFAQDWEALLNYKRPTLSPSASDEFLLQQGEDFVGTMLFARRSIGLALCHAKAANPRTLDEDDEFWHGYTSSLLWLNIASDRLREYFLMGVFQQTGDDEYKEGVRKDSQKSRLWKHQHYLKPFKVAVGTSDVECELLTALRPVAKAIGQRRKERNQIVHDMATRTARRSIMLLREQRENALNGPPPPPPDLTFTELQACSHLNPQYDELQAATINMTAWYLDLINASNLVFQIEHAMRPLRRGTGQLADTG
jgi:hypothetical protein